MIDEVRAHVAERADAEGQPSSPVEWMVDRMIRNVLGDRSQVKIPVQSGWNRIRAERRRQQLIDVAEAEWISKWARRRRRRRRAAWSWNALGPIHNWTVGPDVHLAHRPEDAGLNPLVHEPRAFARVALVSHLGDDLRIRQRQLAQHS